MSLPAKTDTHFGADSRTYCIINVKLDQRFHLGLDKDFKLVWTFPIRPLVVRTGWISFYYPRVTIMSHRIHANQHQISAFNHRIDIGLSVQRGRAGWPDATSHCVIRNRAWSRHQTKRFINDCLASLLAWDAPRTWEEVLEKYRDPGGLT